MDGGIISFDSQLLFSLGMQLLNTAILFAGLSYLLFKPVREFMEKRTQKIKSQIDEVKAEEKRVLEMKNEYESKLENVEEEANQILKEARRKALEKEQEIVEQAKEEANVIKDRALTDIEREKAKMQDEIKKEMIDIASLVASKLVASSIDDKKHNELIDEVIDQMGDVTWNN
ncbi:F0F1 ATP synthase subunit B [Defluviitalea phaphyphila]|uniref:F0F1 ATP synthase subunit B n=1 Tax=Defluviitalea phaphyphila TaxID=1473580 RepID=UPI000730657D|nr:F0F1 ATP synthase subunit B [Defluviitalea phaphyphila]